MTAAGDEERRQRGESLLREANLFRLRQDPVTAEARCRAAVELLPDDATALEMLGDLIRAADGDPEEAMQWYQAALKLRPGTESLEVKIAALILQQGEARYATERLARRLEGGGATPAQRRRQVTLATLMSLLLPGLGQFYNRDRLKGLILMPVWLVTAGLGYLPLLQLLLTVVTFRPGLETEGFLAFLGAVGGSLHLYALLDAAARARKLAEADEV